MWELGLAEPISTYVQWTIGKPAKSVREICTHPVENGEVAKFAKIDTAREAVKTLNI